MPVKLTEPVVKNLTAPEKGQKIHWDSEFKGFGLRVTAGGAKAFIFNYRTKEGREGRCLIGRWDKGLTVELARAAAKKKAAEVQLGGDPAKEAKEKRTATTVGGVLDSFMAIHVVGLKPQTRTSYVRLIEKLLKPRIGDIAIRELKSSDVAALRDELRAMPSRGRKDTPATTQADGAIRVLASAMDWAEEQGYRDAGSNPAKVKLKSTRRRERLFSDNEVSRMKDACHALELEGRLKPQVALGIRLIFATGCRAEEICGLQWGDVDFERGLLRWGDTKTGTLRKPMTEEARDLLEAAHKLRVLGEVWVCPPAGAPPRGRKRKVEHLRIEALEDGFKRTMDVAGVVAGENASLHLIRHWFATKTYTDKSIPLPIAMAIMGHKSVATAMRYAHVSDEELTAHAHEAMTRRREAVEAAGKRGQVVPLNGGVA